MGNYKVTLGKGLSMGDSKRNGGIAGFVPYQQEQTTEYYEKGYWSGNTFHGLLDQTAEANPEKTAVVSRHGTRTYGELQERSKHLAAGLVGQLGLSPSDRVVFQLNNQIEFVELFFGCSRAGVIPVMMLPRHREAEAAHVIETTNARAYVAIHPAESNFEYTEMVDDISEDHPNLDHRICVGGDEAPDGWISYGAFAGESWLDFHGAEAAAVDVNPEAPGVILLSGGTTGLPKAIPRTHNDYTFQWKRWVDVIGIQSHWTQMPWVPIGHNASLNTIVGSAVTAGATLAIHEELKTRSLLDYALEQEVDFFFAVPAQLTDVLDTDDIDSRDLSGIEVINSGGQKVHPSLVREFNDRWGVGFANTFGMAEGPLICTRPWDSVDIQAETVGRPIAPEVDEFRLVDKDRAEEVPKGSPGELAARGPGIFPGYFNNDAANEASFDVDGWFYTGDLLEIGDDGMFRVYGRLKDTIIRGGENVYAPGVEDEIIEHPKVANVAVIGVPDERLGERVCAVIEPESGFDSVTLSDVIGFLDDRGMAVFKKPERLEVVDSLPRTEVGKIDKAQLKDDLSVS